MKAKHFFVLLLSILSVGVMMYAKQDAAAFTKAPHLHTEGVRFDFGDKQITPPVTHVRKNLTAQKGMTAHISASGKFRTPHDFIQVVLPLSIEAGKELGVDPKIILAQAALETNWGRSIPRHPDGSSSYNIFGIKFSAKRGGNSVAVRTKEFRKGAMRRETARFRAYADFREAFSDYVLLIKSPRFHKILHSAKTPSEYAKGLQRAGYATDPSYARKILTIYNSRLLSTLPAGW